MAWCDVRSSPRLSAAFLTEDESDLIVIVAVPEGVGVGVPPIAPSGSPIAVGVGLGVGFLTTTPLFQINFLPDLIQV